MSTSPCREVSDRRTFAEIALWPADPTGHDAIHTCDLPDGNGTRDGVINGVSLDEKRVVITKDSDFFHSHLLQGRPWKLLLVKTGNIGAKDLRDLIERNIDDIERALEKHTLVEIDRQQVSIVA